MIWKNQYTYNEEFCNYEKVRITPKEIFRRVFPLAFGGFLIATIFTVSFFLIFDNPKVDYLEKKQEYLVADVQGMINKTFVFEQHLDRIHQHDNLNYRSALNMEAMPLTIWQGGVGGAQNTVNYENISLEIVKKLVGQIDHLNYQIILQKKSLAILAKMAKEKSEELAHLPAIRPVPGKIMSGFGPRWGRMHTGLDFNARIGTPVIATGDGEIVTNAHGEGGYGICVNINHGHGFVTKYAHLSKMLVKPGQKVKRGQVIAYSGNTGYSTGPHLHYEVIKNGVKIDPINYFYADLSIQDYKKLKEESKHKHEILD